LNLTTMYFSPTGTTRKVVTHLGTQIATILPFQQIREIDFTPKKARQQITGFGQDDLLIIGVPVYAGRVPNVLKEFLGSIEGNGAKAVAVVLFGNRSFDDGLMELRELLTSGGFRVIGAGAFVGEHAFSDTLAKGRPDPKDLVLVDQFARELSEKIKAGNDSTDFWIKGQMPLGNYYTPRNLEGEPVNILKVKPKTTDACTDCKHCVEICPMESISWEDPTSVIGICIKCGACIKGCPVNAKYYDDPGFLGHKLQIETAFMDPKNPEWYL
jgi:NAD-dependent dihydropyrimidine dehydrogenase PreA subunit/flavodoxin